MSEYELPQEKIKQLAEAGRKSLFFLARGILGFKLLTKHIHLPIAQELENLSETKRMVIILPRDWYKTTLASISYLIWRAINNPEIRILLVQNTFTNACSKLAAIKQIFERNQLFRACYPELLPTSSNIWKAESLCINRKGTFPESTFEAAGVNTDVTSRHYDLIVEDDTLAPDFDHMTGAMMQPTRAMVEKCIGWHKLAHPLLVEPALSQILVIGTRWVEDDLLEFIMKNEHQYKILQRAVKENANGEPDINGKLTWEFADDGSPKFTQAVVDQIFAALGTYMASTLYLNLPMSSENMLFQTSWIKYYESPPKHLLTCTSCDLQSAKQSGSSDPDYGVVITSGLDTDTGLIYILNYERGRWNPGEHIAAIFNEYERFKFLDLLVDSISYQRTFCYWLEQRQLKTGVMFPVTQLTSYTASKEDRIRGLQPYFQAGRVLIKAGMSELENELKMFPYGKHDDLVDALSTHIDFWNRHVTYTKEVFKKEKDLQSPEQIFDIINTRRIQLAKADTVEFGLAGMPIGKSPADIMKSISRN